MNACKRNSTALLSLLPEACPGGHAQSPASASKALERDPAPRGLQVRSSLQACASVCAPTAAHAARLKRIS